MNIIHFSPAAIAQMKTNMENHEHGNMALRIAATMTADETVNYGIGFDEAKENDVRFTDSDIDFLVNPDCVELLNGTHIDYVNLEKGQHHFIFLNPNDPNYKPPTEEGTAE